MTTCSNDPEIGRNRKNITGVNSKYPSYWLYALYRRRCGKLHRSYRRRLRDTWPMVDVVLQRREPVYNSVDAHDDDTLLPRWVNWIARASAISRAPPPGILPSEWKNQHQEQVEREGRRGRWKYGEGTSRFSSFYLVPSPSSPLSSLPFSSFFSVFLSDMIRYPSRDVHPYSRDNSTALLDKISPR